MTQRFLFKKNSKLLSKLEKYECPDTTFLGAQFPIVMHKAKGMTITDVDNNKYLDFTACFGVMALGHKNARTLKVIRQQSANLIHGMGDVHPSDAKIKLLETLAKISPFQNPKSLLGLSGGDAIEAALKTSVLATNRARFLSFSDAYHGVQMAPLSLNKNPTFTTGFESWLNSRSIALDFPSTDTIAAEVLNKLEENLKTKEFAALILEPIQARGGTRCFSKDFVQKAHFLCKKYGTILIFDEIFTGFGRTGKMFALEHLNVIPDLLCIGKSLGSGLPLSACMGDILDVWGKSKGEARHTQTFLGHPLACAVAVDTIGQIQSLVTSSIQTQQDIRNEILKFKQQISAKNPKFDFEIRGRGFMHGLHFYSQSKGFAMVLTEELLKRGFVTLPEGRNADVLALTPPLIAQASHYKKIFHSLMDIFDC